MTLIAYINLGISFLIALTVHEFSHAITAKWMGDPTAERMGRVTLNPLAHLDVVGTLMVMFAGIGWGKPVPVNPNYFKNHKLGNAITSFAGPFSNLLLAILSVIISKHIPIPLFIFNFLDELISLNLILAIFNLIPFPPLDGSHIVEAFLPKSLELKWMELQRNGPFILFVILLADMYFNLGVISGIIFGGADYINRLLHSIL